MLNDELYKKLSVNPHIKDGLDKYLENKKLNNIYY